MHIFARVESKLFIHQFEMIKKKFRSGLGFGIGLTVFFILQNLLIQEHQTSKEIMKSVFAGIIAGVIGGFLFGWLSGYFSKLKS